jgi:hypothetical protein
MLILGLTLAVAAIVILGAALGHGPRRIDQPVDRPAVTQPQVPAPVAPEPTKPSRLDSPEAG